MSTAADWGDRDLFEQRLVALRARVLDEAAPVTSRRRAMAELIESLAAPVQAVLRSMRLEPEDVDDVRQQFFVKLLREDFHVLRLWKAEGALAGYLLKVARNMACDVLRRPAPLTELDPEEYLPRQACDGACRQMSPWREVIVRERVRAVEQALESLNPRQQEVVALRHFEGLTHQEIADRLGITLNNASVRLHRAESRLRERLAELDDTDEPS